MTPVFLCLAEELPSLRSRINARPSGGEDGEAGDTWERAILLDCFYSSLFLYIFLRLKVAHFVDYPSSRDCTNAD